MFAQRRIHRFGLALVVLLVSTAGAAAHASLRRAADDETLSARRELVSALGAADLALSSTARWLRHPSQVEFAAPFSDLPASLDVDPAGALVGPPMAVAEERGPLAHRPGMEVQ